MKFGIDMGHNVRPDTGATGVRQEDDVIREVGVRVIEKLRGLGHVVVVCTPSSATSVGNSLYQRVKKANDNNVDIFVSIHFNAGGGRGSEVFAASPQGREIAQKVLEQIVTLGFVNRGVKDGSWLYVIRNSSAPSILIECAFVDSREDMAKYKPEDMARAIVKGLTGETTDGTQPAEETTVPSINGEDEEILKIQKTINRLQIRDDRGIQLQEDGVMGPRTKSAIRRFQRIAGISVDGIPGTQTWNSLNTILSKPMLSIDRAVETATRYIQWRFGIFVDGIFGSITENSVMSFQKNNRLAVDGIVGPNTWEKLIG
jgi:N-acetylmuramoyl-L-alanine amidase